MKKLLVVSIFFALTIIVPLPTMAGADINTGISLPPFSVFEAPREVMLMPAGGVYVVADADSDKPESGMSFTDEKQAESMEKEKPAGPEYKSDWRINVWPMKPPDNIRTPHEMKEENRHTPPDRFD